MAPYIPHRIFNLARLLYVRPETFGPYYVVQNHPSTSVSAFLSSAHTLKLSFNICISIIDTKTVTQNARPYFCSVVT